jgi:hypothetical protein
MMEELAKEISEWLDTLWAVGVEKGVEHKLVHKSLKLCRETLARLEDSGSW